MKETAFFEWILRQEMDQIYESNEKMYEHVAQVDDIDDFNLRIFALIDKWMTEHDKTPKEAMEFMDALYNCSIAMYKTMGVMKKCSENSEQRM